MIIKRTVCDICGKEAVKMRNFKVKERKRLDVCEYGYVKIDLCIDCINKFKQIKEDMTNDC